MTVENLISEKFPAIAAKIGSIKLFDEEVDVRASDSQAERLEAKEKALRDQEDSEGSDVSLSLPEAVTRVEEEIAVRATDIPLQTKVEDYHTQFLELGNQLRLQKQQLKEAQEYCQKQKEFIDTLCHELRNPLNGIIGNVEILETYLRSLTDNLLSSKTSTAGETIKVIEGFLTPLRESVSAIDKCSQQQKSIVDNVLDLSKLEVNKAELNTVPLNFNQLVVDAVQMFNVYVRKKNLLLDLKLPEELWIKADAGRLSQIIVNLVSNAIKFTQEGFIRIQATYESSTSLIISIEDSGIGMNDEEMARLFQQFGQASRSTASEFGGSGLGLLITGKLVELMKGNIHVSSQKGRGTCFTITLPVLLVDEKEKQKIQNKGSVPNLLPLKRKDIKILIVEDSEINQRIFVEYIKKINQPPCQIASDGVEALEKYHQSYFDIIFMDIEMPKMGGLEATQKIRELEKISNRHTIIIGLSGNVDKEKIKIALEQGMDDYITKPYKKEVIYAIVDKYTSKEASSALLLLPALSSDESRKVEDRGNEVAAVAPRDNVELDVSVSLSRAATPLSFKGAFFAPKDPAKLSVSCLDKYFEQAARELRFLRRIFSVSYGDGSVIFKLAEMGIGKYSSAVFQAGQDEEVKQQLLAKLKKALHFMLLEGVAATAIASQRTLEMKGISKENMGLFKRFFSQIDFGLGLQETEGLKTRKNKSF